MQPQVIAGRYEVVRAIGSGGMGTVWLCRDTVLGREVAVKRVGALPGDPAAAARAMREARIAASLNDAHTVGVYDIVDQDDAHWLVMEYVDGQSLAEQIRDEGPLPPTRVAAIGAAIASALARAHERGIVHRDVKPGNILIDRSGTPKISDFGIARAHADDQLTQTGFMTGTPGYLSPELARGGNPTSASDVWALGATLYAAVEGQPPYEAQANPLATLQAIASSQPRPMELAGPLGGAIAAMMDPDPAQRWDMNTAADRLRRVADGDRTMALPAGAAFGVTAPTELIPEPVEGTLRLEPTPVPAPAAYDPPLLPPDQEEQGSRGRGWLAALVVLAIVAALALAWLFSDGFGTRTPAPGSTTTVTSRVTRTETTRPTTTTSATSSSSSTSSTTSTTTTATTTSAAPRDNARLERFVKGYYGDVTNANKRDATWELLTPRMQASVRGGRAGYEAFWSTVKSVDVSDLEADAQAGVVTMNLTFTRRDGQKTEEKHRLTVVRSGSGDDWLIDSDTLA